MKRVLLTVILTVCCLGITAQWVDQQSIQKAQTGDVEAQKKLALYYLWDKDYSNAVKWARIAAEKGHAGAQDLLGSLYRQGLGVEKNMDQFLYWSKKAAAQGTGEGCHGLGDYYRNELKNYSEAVKWYIKGVEAGTYEYYNIIGDCFFELKNYQEAIKWYLIQVDKGKYGGKPYISLGESYRELNNIEEAKKWFLKAASGGDDCARVYGYIGEMYEKNDKYEAIKYYKMATKRKYPWAECLHLGKLYKTIDKDEAIYWFKQSMDAWYAEYRNENFGSADELRALGVEYHPGGKSSSYASSSGSSYSSTSSTSEKCSKCGGKYMITCETCNGAGTVVCNICGGRGGYILAGIFSQCVRCMGMGRLNCHTCGGNKKIACPKCGGLKISFPEGNGNYNGYYGGGYTGGGYNSYQDNSQSNYNQGTTNNRTNTSSRDCPYCKGTGRLVRDSNVPLYGGSDYKVYCNECGGYFMKSTGHSHISCGHCGGSGKLR